MTRPGLAKARALSFVVVREGTLARLSEPLVRELFDRADVVSEGSVRESAAGRVWYGTTSLILPLPEGPRALLTALAERDVHLRVRAIRVASREAVVRAPGRLGRLSCEISVRSDERGLRVDVDVQAPLIERRASSRRGR